MELVGLFALTALLLAGLGIYGVISACGKRTDARNRDPSRALARNRRNILHIVLRHGLGLAIAGAAVGLILRADRFAVNGQLALWSSAHRSV